MDFIVALPPIHSGHDAIVVFVDKFSKRGYFIATHTSVTALEVARIFFHNIFKNHSLLQAIISDRDLQFTSKFWQALFKLCQTQLKMSTAFHPQTNRQIERMNR